MPVDNKFGLILKKEEGEEKVFVQSKSALQVNVYIQSQLKHFVSRDEKNKRKVKCLCKPNDDLFFMVKENSKGKYYVQNYGKNGVHDLECPFYIGEKLFNDKIGEYSSKIFLDTDEVDNPQVNAQLNEYRETYRTTRRRLTYYNFCRDMIEDTVIRAFNSVNQGRTRREQLENFGNDLFWKKFNYAVYDSTKNTKVPQGHKLIYGIITEHDTFFDALDSDENNNKLCVTADEYVTFENKGLQSKYFTISRRRLSIAKKLVNNFGNTTATPYFFIGVVEKRGEDKKEAKNGNRLPHFKRLFVHPIYFSTHHIAFVDSGYERKYAKRLFEERIPFLKPMSGNELYGITKELRNYNYYKDGRIKSGPPYIKYKPDFIEFYGEYVLIVEVSGYDNQVYKKDLKIKAKHYKKLEVKTGIIRYKEVEGKKIG